MTVLSMSNVGKSYRTYPSEWRRCARWFGVPVQPEEHWVLRHVNFELKAGDTLGIVGQNGAGKSTLLKILAGTLKPTEGHVSVHGRLSALLELGMGFNPNLTGRQNASYTLGLMGFSSREIAGLMPAVEDFAEIEAYFDEPLRTCSSGMQMRVAFSLATVFSPEILIVDEALSVGDAYFQAKCFQRIRALKDHGTTLLVVSHDRNAIQTLCQRALLLEKGAVLRDGAPEAVFDYYTALIAGKENEETIEVTLGKDGKQRTSSGTGEVRVEHIGVYSKEGQLIDTVAVGEEVELRVTVKAYKGVDSLVMGYALKERLGQVCFGTNTWHTSQVLNNVRAGDVYQYSVRFPVNLGIGNYSVSVALHDRETHLIRSYEWRDLLLTFTVYNPGFPFQGLLFLPPRIDVIPVEERVL